MPLSAGTTLGHYEILVPIGAGGMGEVYRAHDTKLKRDVAIKVLPEAFARDAERMARFQREAEVLASLNHPNIAAIYGVEDRALVMELVEGASPKGPLPFDDAWKIASQIAAALEYAHERGIMHRDLKPANIMITPDGVVKLLDFGLAKAFTNQREPSASPENSPTLTLGATEVGVILGTAAYMAPEQARGNAVDKRADIWSFGVVLYELLTGERLFTGEDAAEILAAVIHKQPDFAKVPREARRLIEECLQKYPKQRLRDIGDARRLLEGSSATPMQTVPSHSRLGWAAWGVAALAVICAAVLALVHFRETPPAAQAMRLSIALPENATVNSFDLSPDGRTLVLAAILPPALSQLYLRSLDSAQLQPLTGTNAARAPFWSADGRSIGFFADGKLKVVSASGGPVQSLCDSGPATGTWNRDGVILFDSRSSRQILRVSSSGGPCAPVLTSQEAVMMVPVFLPDGRHFFYVANGGGDASKAGVFIADLDHPAPRRVLPDLSSVVYVRPESGSRLAHLLFLRETTLMAQPFDPETLQPAGDVFAVAEPASATNSPPQVAASASASGTLVYLANRETDQQLTWYDRSGKITGKLGPRTQLRSVSLSPNGRTAASGQMDRLGGGFSGMWLYDLTRNVESRFITEASTSPVWTPDGTRIAFWTAAHGSAYLKDVSGGTEELLPHGFPSDFSSDSRFLLYTDIDPKNQSDIWLLPDPLNKSGARKPVPFVQTPFDESQAQFSPDVHWVAYTSNESGQYQIYVRPFPAPASGPNAKWQVSSGARATQPRWRRDGKELFYLEGSPPRFKLMAIPVSAGPRPIAEDVTPKALFEVHINSILPQSNAFAYSPSTDGQSFLMSAVADQDAQPTLNVLVNWPKLVEKETGGK